MVTLELVLETKEGPYPMYAHFQLAPLRIRLEGTCPWIVNPYGRWEEVELFGISEELQHVSESVRMKIKKDLLLVWWYATPFGFCPLSEWRKALEELASSPARRTRHSRWPRRRSGSP
jgi:hypothetical protein